MSYCSYSYLKNPKPENIYCTTAFIIIASETTTLCWPSTHGSCSGIGMKTCSNHTNVKSFNPYNFAFVGEEDKFNFNVGHLNVPDFVDRTLKNVPKVVERRERDKFNFNVEDLNDRNFVNRTQQNVPMVLEWFVGENQTCLQAKRNMSTYVCKDNTNCINFEDGPGYRCSCLQGYDGNPYLSPCCTDINECKEAINKCSNICTNIPGSYQCSCPMRYRGDGMKNGTGCIYYGPSQFIMRLILVLSSILGTTLLVLLGWWLNTYIKKQRAIKKRARYFEKNGGLLLQQQMSSNEAIIERTKVFTIDELQKATDNFSDSRILGQGGHGTVYKGMLGGGRLVAIKKSKIINETEQGEFINEVIILSQINHRNIVKLLGCCLESEVPLLVFEFIPNGTLFQHIHYPSEEFSITWKMRQQIAFDSAGAIAYLHSSSSVPIFHRDIKSSNILLDEKYRAKLSDFGTSRHLTTDQSHVTTRVMGTFGYLDPEYFQSSQFTEKSDVYSFGVVLAELLTGQKAIREISEKDRSLVAWFVSHMESSNLIDIVDSQVLKEGSKERIYIMADLAKRCLNLDGKTRPTMKEVLRVLEIEESTLNVEVQDESGFEQGMERTVKSVRCDNSSSSWSAFLLESSSSNSAEASLLLSTG